MAFATAKLTLSSQLVRLIATRHCCLLPSQLSGASACAATAAHSQHRVCAHRQPLCCAASRQYQEARLGGWRASHLGRRVKGVGRVLAQRACFGGDGPCLLDLRICLPACYTCVMPRSLERIRGCAVRSAALPERCRGREQSTQDCVAHNALCREPGSKPGLSVTQSCSACNTHSSASFDAAHQDA